MFTWSGVWVCGLGLEAGVGGGEAGGAEDPGAGVVRTQGAAEVSCGQRPGPGVVQAEPAAVLAAWPWSVGVIVLHGVHAGRLVLGLHLDLGPREGAGHGGAEEDVDTEHDQEQHPEHHAEPQQPARPQLAVTGVCCNQTKHKLTFNLEMNVGFVGN